MTKNSEVLLSFDRVSKAYKKPGFLRAERKTALREVSFEVFKGEIIGILGLNGAGKTTIIKSIFGIIKPDSGSIRVLGSNPQEESIRKDLGYVPELPYFSPQARAYDALSYYAFLSGLSKEEIKSRALPILSKVGLGLRYSSKCLEFSKGMLQRLAFAQALIHEPSFVVMDEPVSGLDPIAVKDLRDLILELNTAGKTFFLSSHSISELEKVCHRVFILKEGSIVRCVEKKDWEKSSTGLEEIFVKAVKEDA
ncbi:MAG: hypothetical protein Fur0012_11690 [Elusimicrobiota bacterium]